MDKPDNVISLINLATVRASRQQWGVEIDPLRFRANIYIDGARPWEEFDWVGSEIRIGERCSRSIARTAAAAPPTSIRRPDAAISTFPVRCARRSATRNLGVYLIVREGGEVAVGDQVLVPRACAGASRPLRCRSRRGGDPATSRFMCRGCYFIYEEANGLPQQAIEPGTAFADIPVDLALSRLRHRQDDVPALCGKGGGGLK